MENCKVRKMDYYFYVVPGNARLRGVPVRGVEEEGEVRGVRLAMRATTTRTPDPRVAWWAGPSDT